jgi:hypothetical protein
MVSSSVKRCPSSSSSRRHASRHNAIVGGVSSSVTLRMCRSGSAGSPGRSPFLCPDSMSSISRRHLPRASAIHASSVAGVSFRLSSRTALNDNLPSWRAAASRGNPVSSRATRSRSCPALGPYPITRSQYSSIDAIPSCACSSTSCARASHRSSSASIAARPFATRLSSRSISRQLTFLPPSTSSITASSPRTCAPHLYHDIFSASGLPAALTTRPRTAIRRREREDAHHEEHDARRARSRSHS